MQKWTAVSKSKIPEDMSGTDEAPEDMVWVCGACGKTSRTRYGFDKDEKRVCDYGWDESCMLNAVLCYKQKDEKSLNSLIMARNRIK